VLSVAKSGVTPVYRERNRSNRYSQNGNASSSHGDEGMQRAIIGGVKTIEHGTEMSDALWI
jgi:hypothetical protein